MTTELLLESKGKSIYKYRTVMDVVSVHTLIKELELENLSDVAAIQYKYIGLTMYDCVFLLKRPVESFQPKSGTLLTIQWAIKNVSWKDTEKIIHTYKVYLDDDRVKEIEAAERPLPFIIEPSLELGKNAYTLYSYYSSKQIVGELVKDLLNPEEEYAVLYGPEIKPSSYKPLHALALALCSELTPSKQASNQAKFLASHLITLNPEQAAKELLSSTAFPQAIRYLGEIGEKKETGRMLGLLYVMQ